MAHSSSGLGHRPLKAEITGSKPVCATKGKTGRKAGLSFCMVCVGFEPRRGYVFWGKRNWKLEFLDIYRLRMPSSASASLTLSLTREPKSMARSASSRVTSSFSPG